MIEAVLLMQASEGSTTTKYQRDNLYPISRTREFEIRCRKLLKRRGNANDLHGSHSLNGGICPRRSDYGNPMAQCSKLLSKVQCEPPSTKPGSCRLRMRERACSNADVHLMYYALVSGCSMNSVMYFTTRSCSSS